MKRWFKKISVVFITILTLGLYIPPVHINTNADDNKENFASKANVNEDTFTPVAVEKSTDLQTSQDQLKDYLSNDYFINGLTEKAKEQAITKLGPRIINQVEDEFNDFILPNIEAVLQSVLVEAAEDDLKYYGITEQPSRGLGERIFHIYDERTQKDIIRFHVRREKRPLEGYWFNFHYHLSADNFEKHHDIGEIYWDKNVPPQWMA